MRTLLPFLALIVLSGCSRSTTPTTVAIADATQPSTLSLSSSPRASFVSGISLRVRGQLDGTGYVYAANWPTQALSGAVDWRIYHDYFQTSCVVHYRPAGVRAGSLSIQYEFH